MGSLGAMTVGHFIISFGDLSVKYSKYSPPLWMNNFKAYCKQHNYDLLPDDCMFIVEVFSKLHRRSYKAILDVYLKKWLNGIGEGNNRLEGQSMGRRKANEWLLSIMSSENRFAG